jgi:hypothetical protein
VRVVFDHPEKFTDVKDDMMETEKGRNAILKQIAKFIVERSEKLLPEGYTLTLTFTDIDLAGDFDPSFGPQFDHVRIVKSIYPPAFKFTYVVTGPTGEVVKQGAEDIRDLAFDMRTTLDRQDPLHFEKDILSDWMRSTLRGLPKP